MARRVRLLPSALADLDEIWLSVAARNERAADSIYFRLRDAADFLAEDPGAGRTVSDNDSTLRIWAGARPYLIFYRQSSQGVTIGRIFHGARRYDPLNLRF